MGTMRKGTAREAGPKSDGVTGVGGRAWMMGEQERQDSAQGNGRRRKVKWGSLGMGLGRERNRHGVWVMEETGGGHGLPTFKAALTKL